MTRRLAELGFQIDRDLRRIVRTADGLATPLTATFVTLLNYFDEGAAPLTIDGATEAVSPAADPAWVASQIGKLADRLAPLGLLIQFMAEDGGIRIHLCRDEPTAAPAETLAVELREQPEPFIGGEAPAAQAEQLRRQLYAARMEIESHEACRQQLHDQAGAARDENLRLAAERDAIERLRSEVAAENDTLHARVAELEEAMKGAAVIAHHAGEELKDKDARLAALQAEKAELLRQLDAKPQLVASTEPLVLAPKHLTIPVSEQLYRWIEGTALTNRRSPEDVARAMLVAIWKVTLGRRAA